MLKIIQKRGYMFVFSVSLMVISAAFLSVWKLKPGIDFTGGTLMELKFSGDVPPKEKLIDLLQNKYKLESVVLQMAENGRALVRFAAKEGDNNEEVQKKLKAAYSNLTIEKVDYVSSTISGELKSKAIFAVILASVAIAGYIAWAFRQVSRPVSSWIYGVSAVIALIHDLLITAGVFSFLGHFYGIEVDIPFIAALLTILGYSVNDTIVVFDRIRENLNRAGAKDDFEQTVNRSINETLARSINTSMTVVLVLLALFLLGGSSIKYFALALLVGVFYGTYSSIFVASALLVEIWEKKRSA